LQVEVPIAAWKIMRRIGIAGAPNSVTLYLIQRSTKMIRMDLELSKVPPN
jgi:hypothetical protein